MSEGCDTTKAANVNGGIVLSLDTYLIAVPDTAPPYDCDLHGTACQSPGGGPDLPAARFADPPAVPALPALPAPERAAQQAPGALGAAQQAPGALASCLGAAWPRQFAQAIVETLAGTRPIRQLVPWTTERSLTHIRALCPAFRTDGGPRIQRVLSSSPSADVVEVTVIAGFGPRTRALAMRFEHIAARQPAPGLPARPARWLCTDIETG
jgi:uncharacterized protein DUF6459